MSLINDLLTDLEKRRGEHREPEPLLADLAPVAEDLDAAHGRRGTGSRLLPGFLFLCAATAAGYLWFERPAAMAPLVQDDHDVAGVIDVPSPDPAYTVNASEPQLAVVEVESSMPGLDEPVEVVLEDPDMPTQPDAAQPTVVALVDDSASIETDKEEVLSADNDSAALQRIHVDDEGGIVRLKLSLSGKPQYRTYQLTDPHRMVVEFDGAEYEVSGSPIADNRHISAVHSSTNDATLKVIFDLNEPMQLVESRYLSEPDTSQLLLSLKSQTDRPDEMKTVVVAEQDDKVEADTPVVIRNRQMQKRPSSAAASPAETDDYEIGLRHYSRSEFRQSIAALNSAIAKDPQHGRAHYLLVSALLQLNDRAAAEAHIEKALHDVPDHWEMRRLYAHLLIDRGEKRQALVVLQASQPRLDDAPDYHALIAALHQQLEDHALAVQAYRQLVEVVPANSVWWMGMGISLEALDRPDEAVVSYRMALESGALAVDLRQFVSSRIVSLSGEQRS